MSCVLLQLNRIALLILHFDATQIEAGIGSEARVAHIQVGPVVFGQISAVDVEIPGAKPVDQHIYCVASPSYRELINAIFHAVRAPGPVIPDIRICTLPNAVPCGNKVEYSVTMPAWWPMELTLPSTIKNVKST